MLVTSGSLLTLIKDSFDEGELQDLCFELDVGYEDLPAVGRAGKAREMIIYCEKNGRLPYLLDYLRKHRPHLDWPENARPLTQSQLLGTEEKPLRPYEPQTIEIPAGPFLMGSDNSDPEEAPQHEVNLAIYHIGQYPLTNRQYGEFLKQVPEQDEPTKVGWFLREPPADKLDHPVVGVSWHDARAYCQWLSEKTEKSYRLPTEAEWEKAARGLEGFIYPWGNQWQDGRCQTHADETTAINAHPEGASSFGCQDMLGNVQEWTSTLWGSDSKETDFPYPYRSDDGREDLEVDARLHRVYRIHRGGSYRDAPAELRCTARATSISNSKLRWRGFRVALDI